MTLTLIWSKLSGKTKAIIVFVLLVVFGSIISMSIIGYYKNEAFKAQQETVQAIETFITEKEVKEKQALDSVKKTISNSTAKTSNIIKKQKQDEAFINKKHITNDDINELVARFKNGSD